MKTKIILSMLFLILSFPLCKKESPVELVVPVYNFHIEGLVTDYEQPKSGVRVELMRWGDGHGSSPISLIKLNTDADGRYSIKYRFVGYCREFGIFLDVGDSTNNNRAFVSCTDELQIINFELQPGRDGMRTSLQI